MAKRMTIKVEKLPIPQSVAEAVPMLRRFAEVSAEVELALLAADEEIAEIKAVRDVLVSPHVLELKRLQAALKPFAQARLDEITGGKRKSAPLGGCLIGFRTGTPALDYPKGEEDQLVDDLKLLGFEKWAVRTKEELDKEALLKALKPDSEDAAAVADAEALAGLGFGIKQAETFFIERQTSAPAEAATVGREAA